MEQLHDVVVCGECRFVGVNLARTHCPDCMAVLGEVRLTAAEIAERRAEHHNELVRDSLREELASR